MATIRGTVCSVATVFALALIGATPALGATHIWTGGANGLWSASGNWNGGVPTTGEPGGTIVQFNASTTSSMNIAGLAVDQIHFAGSNNVISGTTGLTISGASLVQNIVSDADGNVLAGSLPLTLANATVEAVSNSGTLTVNGAIGGTPGLVTAGSGDVSLSGTAPNTYAGATTIISGTLHIGTSSGDVIAGSSLNVGDGLTPGARLLLENSSDISPQTPVIVNSDGVIDFQNHSDSAKSLTVNGGSVLGANLAVSNAVVMHDGTVTLASSGTLTAGSVNMIGGTISGLGPGVLALGGDLQATSSAAGPATISAPVRLGANPTITVAAGTAPELSMTGAIGEIGGPRSLTKAGTGTLLIDAVNTYSGTTTISQGTLIADSTQAGPFSVAQNATLTGSGTLGPTSVSGTITPTAPGLHTGALSFSPTGKLSETLTSVAPASIPSLDVTGTVTIDPSATAGVTLPPAGTAVPHGFVVPLISNDASDAITGQFANLAAGSTLTTAAGVPLTVAYAGGDGNDLTLTAGNVAPQITSLTATPSRVAAGQPVAFSASASDANQDPITTTWSFGDGATGIGTSTSHAYATPGTYTVTATVSDGLAQAQSTTVVTATGTSGPGPGTTGTTTVRSLAYGADFSLTIPRACVRKGTRFIATLTIKRAARNRYTVSKVNKVVFAVNRSTSATKRTAPFRARLAVPAAVASGGKIVVGTKSYVRLRSGKTRTKAVTATVKVC